MYLNRVKLIREILKNFNVGFENSGVKFILSKYGSYMQILVQEKSYIAETISEQYRSRCDTIEDLRLKNEAMYNEGLDAPIGYKNPYWTGYVKQDFDGNTNWIDSLESFNGTPNRSKKNIYLKDITKLHINRMDNKKDRLYSDYNVDHRNFTTKGKELSKHYYKSSEDLL